MQQRLWRGAGDDDVRPNDGGARGWWGANPSSSRGSAGDAARDGRRPLRAHGDDDDDRGELSSGGESDDSRATVVTHGVGSGSRAHHGKSLSGVSSSGGDFALSDAERGDGEFRLPGRDPRGGSHSRLQSVGSIGSIGRGEARTEMGSASHARVGSLGVGLSGDAFATLRRVDSKTHVTEALASVPGLHKRGIDLPMTKRLAFRKCRGVARNKSLLTLLLMLFVAAATFRRAPNRSIVDRSSSSVAIDPRRDAVDGGFPARRFGQREDRAFGDGDAGDGAGMRGEAGDEEGTRFGTGRGG